MSLINDLIEKEMGMSLDEINITVSHHKVLAKIYIRDDKALHADGKVSSIYLPDSSKEIDKFINCCGLVIKMHPSCYEGEKYQKFGPDCKVGDWIFFKRGNGDQVNFKGHSMMEIYDDLVLGTVQDPKDIRRD